MKRLIILCLIFLATVNSYGQFSFGVSAGSNLSTMTAFRRDLSTFRINPILGYNVNLITEYKLNPSFSLCSGLTLSQKGFNQHIKYFFRPGLDTTADMTSKLNYLELPIYLKFSTNLKNSNLFYAIGPFIGYGLHGEVTTEIKGRINEITSDKVNWNKFNDNIKSDLVKEYGYTNLKRTDFGIVSLVGINLNRFMLSLSYQYSLNNIMWEFYQDEKMSNSSLSLSIGYFIK